MTETFSKSEFEAALPTNKKTNAAMWRHVGIVKGEHVYAVDVKKGVVIYVRSSVGVSGVAAGTGEDSIRVYLASDDRGTPLGSKDSRWIARTKNWRTRLVDLLRKFWVLGSKIPVCACGTQTLALKVKTGKNEGRWFAKCPKCVPSNSPNGVPGMFVGWLDAEPRTEVA